MAKADKRQQIMQAAERLFTSRRLHEITLDDVVREARVGKGTVYRYFADKDDLFFQVATSGFAELCELLRRDVVGEAPFREQVHQACRAISDFFAQRRQLFRMIQTEDARMSLCHGRIQEKWAAKRQLLVESLGGIFRKGQADGQVRDDLAPETLAHFLLGVLRARGRSLREASVTVEDELLVDLFLSGAGRKVSMRAVHAGMIGNEVNA
ncbi:MAG: TetR/AcrR family transcriptional regulator [Phycisphaerae bacterium]|nr:TetR/AcrR family transcriptional regulator [Phycisphaerae bacterium]